MLRVELPEQTAGDGYAKVQTVPALRLLHLTIPLGMFPPSRAFDAFTVFRQAQWGGVALPLGLVLQTRCYRTERPAQSTFALLLDEYTRAFESRYEKTNVLSTALS